MLDEPTNHLDMDSIAWLETFLMNYQGAVIIVSHDRYFLNRVVTKIVEIDQGNVTTFTGNYTAYAQKKAMLREAQMQAYLNQQREIKHQEEVIAKLKSFNREKSIKRAESREKMLDKIEVLERPTEVKADMHIELEPQIVSGEDVLTVEGLSKAFPPQTLFSHLDFEIKRGERVALIGNNGTGKTTILKIINGVVPADAGRSGLAPVYGSVITIRSTMCYIWKKRYLKRFPMLTRHLPTPRSAMYWLLSCLPVMMYLSGSAT